MKRRAFTLIELLLAAAIMTVLLGSLYGLYAGALRIRERMWQDIQTAAPYDEALRIIRRDLTNTVTPSVMGKPLVGTTLGESGVRRDTLDFGTASGVLLDSEPWGDMMEVQYGLIDPEDGNTAEGLDLGRTLTRNLLAQTVVAADPQRLLHHVNSLAFDYWDTDNQYWTDNWDYATDSKMPAAVRVRIEFAEIKGRTTPHPLEMVCQVMADNTTQTTTSDTSGGTQ